MGEPEDGTVAVSVPPASPSATEPAGMVAVEASVGSDRSEPMRTSSVAPPTGPELVACTIASPGAAPDERSTPAAGLSSEAAAEAPPSEEVVTCACAEAAGVEAPSEALVSVEFAATLAPAEASGVETLAAALVPEELEPEPLLVLALVEALAVETLAEAEAVGVDEALGCAGGGGGGGAACCTLAETLADAVVPEVEVEAEAETLTLVEGVGETVAEVVVETVGASVETPGSPSA